MKKQHILVLLITMAISGHTQPLQVSNAWEESLGKSSLSGINFWNTKSNPSSSVFIDNSALGIDIGNKYIIEDLNTALLLLNLRLKKEHSLVFSYTLFGNKNFNENQLSISYSILLSAKFSSAITLINNLTSIKSEEYKDFNYNPGFKISIFYKLNTSSSFSSFYENTYIYGNQNYNLSLAFCYHINKNTSLYAQTSISNYYLNTSSLGFSYNLNEKFGFNFGIKNNDISTHFGVEFHIQSIRINCSFSYHQYLRINSNISLMNKFSSP